MNSGIVASRYAKAFLKYVQEEGDGKTVYSQSCVLVHVMNEIPQFKEYIKSTLDIPLDRKLTLLSDALGAPLDKSIADFLKMVSSHRRDEYFPRMLLSFIEQYRVANNIKVGSLVTAVGDDGLKDRLESLFHDRTGAEIHLEEKVSPEIIGGFVFELDGWRLDASVANHLDRLRRPLVEKKNRIV